MSLILTYLQEIRALKLNPLDRDEWRFTRYGLLTAVKEMTNSPNSIITRDLMAKAKVSEGRLLKVPVWKNDEGVTIAAVRSCTIGDLENTTELVEVTWTTLVADMSMLKAEHHKNEVSYLEDFNRKIMRLDNGFAKAVEQLIFTELESEKSIIHGSPLVGAGTDYPLVGNALQVSPAEQKTFFNDLEVIMEGDDFYSEPFKVLGSTTLKSPVRHYGEQVVGNNETLNYQYDAFDFRFSNHLTNGAGVKSTGFCMTDGSIGLMTRIAIDSEMGNKAGDGSEWGKVKMEKLGYEVGYLYKSKCSDESARPGLEHLEATMVENWQLSIDVAIVTPYNSDTATQAGVIKKFEFLTA